MGISAIKSRVFLIGGTSHAGKSTLAQALASRLGWYYRTTDKLARHPGRPWQTPPKQVPDHVADHYLSLPVDALIVDVLRHYRDNVWPLVEDIVTYHATDPAAECLVMEGSALLPELVAALPPGLATAVWLTASDELFGHRIYTISQYATKSPREKQMIDKFLARTLRFDAYIVNSVKRLGLACVDIEPTATLDALVDTSLSVLLA